MGIKQSAIASVREQVMKELEAVRSAALSAHDAATHEDAKPENDKDTRSVEAAYLAGAQAARVGELEQVLARLGSLKVTNFGPGVPLGAGALVEVALDGVREWYLVLPAAGGFTVQMEGRQLRTITPSSPLGAVLAGSFVGDDLEYECNRTAKCTRDAGLRFLHAVSDGSPT